MSSAICSSEIVATSRNLPTKYDARGIGEPARRLSPPLSRSMQIPMARAWNPLLSRPEAIIPAAKYWLKGTSGPVDVVA